MMDYVAVKSIEIGKFVTALRCHSGLPITSFTRSDLFLLAVFHLFNIGIWLNQAVQ